MSDKKEFVKGKDGVKIELADQPAKTREEVYREITMTAVILAVVQPRLAPYIEDLAGIMTELIHWQYDATGQHFAPSEMIQAQAASEEMAAQQGEAAINGGSKKPTHYDA